MKKTTFLKIVLLIFVFLQHFNSYSQNYIPFAPRYNQDIKGDMLLIGNSILNRNPNPNTKAVLSVASTQPFKSL